MTERKVTLYEDVSCVRLLLTAVDDRFFSGHGAASVLVGVSCSPSALDSIKPALHGYPTYSNQIATDL